MDIAHLPGSPQIPAREAAAPAAAAERPPDVTADIVVVGGGGGLPGGQSPQRPSRK